jgi:membrane protease YdiL (CAAX protease family)
VDQPSLGPPRLWPVFVAYIVAFVSIVALSLVAAGLLRVMYPDVPDHALFDGLPGLVAGGLASSTALALTVALFNQPLELALLRLVPGWETGRALAVMIVGMLALGQALDSLTVLAGLGDKGALAAIRSALAAAAGPQLFLAVLVIGVLAGSAEELFFRGYMQTRLGQRVSPALAVVVTSLAFGLLHLEWIHGLLAFVLGLYLGWITEVAGSALPAIACHVINNALFTVLTALVGTVGGEGPNAALLAGCGCVFVGSVVWLRRCRTW